MIKITVKQLKKLGACDEGLSWFQQQSARSLSRICSALLNAEKVVYAFWLLPRLMTHPQKVAFAIFAAEQVLYIFEKERPGDKRPRQAIQAAKDFLAGKIQADVAADAAYAADAADAAYAANAAYAAANAAADAAYAAYAAANAANAAADAAYATRRQIINYGLDLLGEKPVGGN